MIELTDIAFALDSILAAIALTPKFWIVFTGGLLGVILMRLAANWMIKIIHKLPHLELTAYVLVLIIGLKVILEGLMLPLLDFDHPNHWAFWAFWGLMFITITLGFRPRRSKKTLVST